jgi:hypothetical protein
MRRSLFSLLFVAIIAYMSVSGDVAQSARLTPPVKPADYFLGYFDTLALTADYGPFNRRPAWIRKWTGPVTVILEPGARQLRAPVEKTFARISKWTGLPFRVVSGHSSGPARKISAGNVIRIKVIETADSARQFLAEDIVCQTETHGMGGALHTAFIILSSSYTDCLKHEVMHVLGFDSHWRPSEKTHIRSVLAMRESPLRASDYTRWDVMAIRLLYNQRMNPGLPRQEGLELARELIAGGVQRASLLPKDAVQ